MPLSDGIMMVGSGSLTHAAHTPALPAPGVLSVGFVAIGHPAGWCPLP